MPEISRENLHEIVHTAYIVGDMFDNHIGERQEIAADDELKAAAELASEALAAFYQLAASRLT